MKSSPAASSSYHQRVVNVERVPLESRRQRVRLAPQLLDGDVRRDGLVGGHLLVQLGHRLRRPELEALLGRVVRRLGRRHGLRRLRRLRGALAQLQEVHGLADLGKLSLIVLRKLDQGRKEVRDLT